MFPGAMNGKSTEIFPDGGSPEQSTPSALATTCAQVMIRFAVTKAPIPQTAPFFLKIRTVEYFVGDSLLPLINDPRLTPA